MRKQRKSGIQTRKWRFGDMRLHVKFLLIIFLLCVCLQVSNYLATRETYRVYDEQLYRMTTQTLTSFVGQVETEFNKIETLTLSMIGDSGIQQNLMMLNDSQENEIKKIKIRRDLQNQVRNYMMGTDAFEELWLFVESDDSKIVWTQSGKWRIEPQTVDYAYENGAIRFVMDQEKMLMCRRIRQIKNMEFTTLATMVGIIDMEKLVNDCNWVYANAGVDILDISIFSDGECLYCGNVGNVPTERNGYTIQNGRFIVQASSKMGWDFVISTSYESILASTRESILHSVTLTVVIALLAIGIGALFVRMITRHLDKLLLKFDAFVGGRLPTELEGMSYQDRNDEIGRLHRHFDRMALEYKRLSEENYNRMLLHKETEYRQLQQQIQPHFIFNALSSIMWMAHQNGDEETSELALSLAQLLRASMSADGDMNSVQSEIKIVQAYMKIQSARYGDRLRFEIQIPDELNAVLVPRMTIQPLVENAIHYAAEEMLDTCVIRVFGQIVGESAVLIVEDNGDGMEEDILGKLETGEIKARGTGIGLRNIHQRIQLAFSNRYGLEIHSACGQTQVRISVPFRPENELR